MASRTYVPIVVVVDEAKMRAARPLVDSILKAMDDYGWSDEVQMLSDRYGWTPEQLILGTFLVSGLQKSDG